MAKPMFQTAEELILANMSRAEKRGSKASSDVCFDVVSFLAGKLAMRYRAVDVREISQNVHQALQSIEIPERAAR